MLRKLFSLQYILLLFILIIAVFLRFYSLHFPAVGFEFDQEYAAQFANTILTVYPIQMIGQGLSVQGLFMGPFYFYYLVPFFFLTHLDPIGGYIGSDVLGLITIVAYFFIFRRIFNTKIALLIALFRAFLYSALSNDWTMAPSYSSELALMLSWYCLYLFWHGSRKAILPIAFLAGIYTSFHPILFPFYLVILLIFIIKRKFIRLRFIPIAVILFLLPMSSLIAFEYFRHFLEIKTLFSLSHSSRAEPKTWATLLAYIKIVFYFPYTYLNLPNNNIIRNLVAFIVLICVSFAAYKKVAFWQDTFHRVIFIATPILVIGYYFLLPVHAPDYYFLAAEMIYFVYVLATFGLLLNSSKGRIVVAIIVIYIAWLNMTLLYASWTTTTASLKSKEDVVRYIVKTQGNNQYNTIYDVGTGWQYGYGYLFRYYTTVYNVHPNDNPATITYTLVARDDTYNPGTGKQVYGSGGIRVFATKNK